MLFCISNTIVLFLLGNVVANLWTWNAMFLIIFFCTVLTEFSESLVRVVVYDDFCCKEPHNSFTAEAKISVAKIKTLKLSQNQQRRKYQKSILLSNIDIGYSSISFSIVIIILYFISFVGEKGWNSFQMTRFLKPIAMDCVGFFFIPNSFWCHNYILK